MAANLEWSALHGPAKGWIPVLHDLWGETWAPTLGLAPATAAALRPGDPAFADVWAGAVALNPDRVEAGVRDGTLAVVEVSESKRLKKVRSVVEKLRGEGFTPADMRCFR